MGATRGAQTAALLLATFFVGHVAAVEPVDNNESHARERERNLHSTDDDNFVQLPKSEKIVWDSQLQTLEKKIPLDLLKQLQDIGTYDELMQKMVEPGRRFVTRSFRSNPTLQAATAARQLRVGPSNFSSPVEIGPIFDKRAFCRPRRVPVHVPQPADPMVIYQPMCIQIERCGGCCAHELFHCVPTLKRNATRKVVALRYPHAGAEFFQFEKVTSVKIQRHVRCKCQCKTQPEDCSVHQVYNKLNCRCTCPRNSTQLKCKLPKIWNERDCKCKCPEADECSTGTYFDPRMCRCRSMAEILAYAKIYKNPWLRSTVPRQERPAS